MKQLIIGMTFFLFFSCSREKNKATVDGNFYYTCSMDPQVISDKAGKCPICKMELTKVQKQEAGLDGQIALSEQQVRLGNIHVDSIRNGEIGDQVVLTGTVNFDQNTATNISARINGRIEKLYFKNLGEQIKKGDPVFEFYSEELNSAKQEYLLLQDKQRAFANENLVNFQQLLQASKNKLLLWGMTEQQIQEMSKNRKAISTTLFYSPAGGYVSQLNFKEGDYLMEGASLLKISSLEQVWVEAQVYTSQLAEINKNSQALARFPDLSGLELSGKIDFVNPEINPDTRINLIRVRVPNQHHFLKPGMAAYVVLNSPKRRSLSLPSNAVIREADASIVWIETGKNRFQPKMVETGLEMDDQIEIKSGLTNGMAVVVSGAYLLNSEYLFKRGGKPMEVHRH